MPESYMGGQNRRTVQRQKRLVMERDAAEMSPVEVEEVVMVVDPVLDDLSYDEIRTIAKGHGLSAGGSKKGIIARIKAFFRGEG